MKIYQIPEIALVGTYVYAPYEPQNVGKIIEVTKEKRGGYPIVIVRWMRPKKSGEQVTKEWTNNLNNFMDLITDHEKKYMNHIERLKQAKKIWDNVDNNNSKNKLEDFPISFEHVKTTSKPKNNP